MKTIYKKALITVGAALLLEVIIVYFLYTSINAFYTDLTRKSAFLLAEQVKNMLNAEKLDISTLSPYNKYPRRSLLKKISGTDSEILHVLLIDTTHKIILSDDPSVEGKVYTDEKELSLLQTDEPTIVSKKWEESIEILDVIYPLVRDSVKQGYLRTVVSLKHLENFYQSRRKVLIIASIFTLSILVVTVFLTSRIYQRNLQHIKKAIDKINQSDFQYRLKYQTRDEFAPVFSRLNDLFDKTFDLNESFKQSEERIKAMMRVIHEGLLILGGEMKILSYNEYLLDLFHIRNRSHPEEELYQIYQSNPKLLEIYRRAKDPLTHAVRSSLSIKLPSGRYIDVQINALCLAESRNSNSVIFYIKNLGLLKELEQNLHRSMKYTIISQLSSSIGHEIRNPLSSLAIHTEIVDNLTAQLPADKNQQKRIKKSIRILNSEIERLTKLIDQFFNLAKPQEIQLSFEDINSVIKEVIDLVQQQAYESSVKIHHKLRNGLPLVNISRDQIKQVILNIIINAFDAMPDGGDLYLATREMENHVDIIIRDTGVGIPENIQDKIFDLYFSTKPNGGGIGLAISKKIIEAHEGKIYFKSEKNKGTCFIIELPRA